MGLAGICRRIANSGGFQFAIIVVIILNAVLLGLETFSGIARDHGDLLKGLDRALLAIFVTEIAIRLIAYAPRVGRFFGNGWNAFDFVVVAAAFIPGLSGSSTLLRLIRLARITRLVSVIPELRVIAIGFVRSIRGVGGLALLTLLLVYVYAILGWSMFADEDPDNWGNVGTGMFTVFKILTLEGWPEIYDRAAEITDWAWLYFLSFILVATFVVLNMVIGVVLASLEDARKLTASRLAAGDHHVPAYTVHRRLAEIRSALEDLERELPEAASSPATTDPPVRS
jgi:voltage-gated sodium channel